jgi:hypothetical protein
MRAVEFIKEAIMMGTRIRRKTTVSPVSSHERERLFLTGSRILAIALMLTGGILLSGCQKKNEQVATTPPPAEVLTEKGLTIALELNKDPDPLKASLDKHSDVDHCRWQNLTSTDRKVHLKSGWPFMEPEAVISVPAYGLSAWYSLDKTRTSKDYPYDVTPSLFDGGTSAEPSVGVSD